jgi:hypothetical protein
MATLNYTPAQQTQLIEFYQQWLPRVNAFGYDNLPDGYHTYYRHGKKLAKEQAAAKVAEAKAAARSIQWTAEEYDAVALGYMTYGKNGYKQAIKDFRLVSQRHSDNAIKLATYSCAHLDTKSDVEGMADYAQGLLDALNAIEEGRFKGTR